MTLAAVPDVSLHAAMSSELVLHEVGVVGGGDEIMAKRLAHVLEDAPPLWVKDGALSRAKVHQEAVKCHGIQHLCWKHSRMSEPSHQETPGHTSSKSYILYCPCTCVRRLIALNELLGVFLDVTFLQLLLPQEVLQVSLG